VRAGTPRGGGPFRELYWRNCPSLVLVADGSGRTVQLPGPFVSMRQVASRFSQKSAPHRCAKNVLSDMVGLLVTLNHVSCWISARNASVSHPCASKSARSISAVRASTR